jgi:predicted RNA-binding protein with RPS1 domain
LLKVGDTVQVKVLSLDPDRKRISLSMRELEEDPWSKILSEFQEGQLVEGTITKLTKFGAFASLSETGDLEIEGLIHISELSDRRIEHPREVVEEGQVLTLRIIKLDKERRRIGLSLKRVDSPEYAEADWQAAMRDIAAEDDEDQAGEVSPEAPESAPDEAVVDDGEEPALEASQVEEAEAVEAQEPAESDTDEPPEAVDTETEEETPAPVVEESPEVEVPLETAEAEIEAEAVPTTETEEAAEAEEAESEEAEKAEPADEAVSEESESVPIPEEPPEDEGGGDPQEESA